MSKADEMFEEMGRTDYRRDGQKNSVLWKRDNPKEVDWSLERKLKGDN